LFRSEQYALVDNACREYLFVSEFFMVRGQPALDLFNQIMGKTSGLLKVNFFPCHLNPINRNDFRKIWKPSWEIVTTPSLCFFVSI
jgi:hypothetical protein